MKKLIIFGILFFLFCITSVLATSSIEENIYLQEKDLLKIKKPISKLCSYDYCEDLINATRLVQLKDYRTHYLAYLSKTNKELYNDVKLRGFVVTKIVYE